MNSLREDHPGRITVQESRQHIRDRFYEGLRQDLHPYVAIRMESAGKDLDDVSVDDLLDMAQKYERQWATTSQCSLSSSASISHSYNNKKDSCRSVPVYSVTSAQRDNSVNNDSDTVREAETTGEASESEDPSWLTNFVGDEAQVRLIVAKALKNEEQHKGACYNCGDVSHRVRECPLLKRKSLNSKAAPTNRQSQGPPKTSHKVDSPDTPHT